MAKTDQRAAVTSNYAYDAIYELTGVTQGTNTTESYTYDPVGNRLSSLGVSPYSINVSNELTSTPNTIYSQGGEQGADAAAAVSSISGLATLALTKGNVCRAAKVAQVEGVATTPFAAGLGEAPSIPDLLDSGQNAVDLIHGEGCKPKPDKCPAKCPQ